MTQDALFSANFHMYDAENIEHQFTLRSDDADSHLKSLVTYKARLLAQGFSATLNAQAANKQPGRMVAVSGIVKGYFTPRDGGQGECYWLYGDNGKYRVATVYPELWGQAPASVVNIVDSSKARRMDAAPERDKAISAGTYISMPFPLQARLEPQVDYDGNVRLSENGKPMFRFAGFVGAPEGKAVNKPLIADSDVPF